MSLLMKALLVPPQDSLRSLIECFFQFEDPDALEPSTLLPDGTVSILFNLGAPQRAATGAGDFNVFRRSWIAGLRDRPVVVEPTAGVHLVGVSFKPGGLYPFLKIPASEFNNQVVEMDAVWGTRPERVCERLDETPAEGRCQLLQDLLLGNSDGDLRSHKGVAHSLDTLTADPGVPIRSLAKDLGVSRKHLIRLFREHVGTNPKGLARVLRFQQVIRRIVPSTRVEWADLAVDCGYYDQAHMIQEFKRMAGVTPSAYLKQIRESAAQMGGALDLPGTGGPNGAAGSLRSEVIPDSW